MPPVNEFDYFPTRSGSELGHSLDSLPRGAVVTDLQGCVAHMNSAARALLDRHDGLRLRDGMIEASHRPANDVLRQAMSNATHPTTPGGRRGDSVRCVRPSGRHSYVVHVTPLDAHSRTGPALVVIVDPEYEPRFPKAQLRRMLGLTSAEADVASLVVRGTGLKPISEELSLSLTTVRTHLQHIFDKTNTHRQAELVRLLFTIAP